MHESSSCTVPCIGVRHCPQPEHPSSSSTLWVPRVHGPITTGPLPSIFWTGQRAYTSITSGSICLWKGPCGDSARCEDSAGIDGVVYGADIYRCSSLCQRSVHDWARPRPLWHIGSDTLSLCRIENWRRIFWCEGDEDERVLTHVFHVVAQRTAIGPFFAAFDIAPSPSQVTSPIGDGHLLIATSAHP